MTTVHAAADAPIDFSRVELVSWDVDGTLYPANSMKRAYLWLSLRSLFSRRCAAAWRQWHALARFRRLMAGARRGGGALPSDALDERPALLEMEEQWYGPAIEIAGPRPGVPAWLEHFRQAGIPQVVVSDYTAKYKLQRLGLASYFDGEYPAETVGHLKPSPVVFKRMLAERGCQANALLHIGDRPDTDLVAAHAVGAQVLLVDKSVPATAELVGARTMPQRLSAAHEPNRPG